MFNHHAGDWGKVVFRWRRLGLGYALSDPYVKLLIVGFVTEDFVSFSQRDKAGSYP